MKEYTINEAKDYLRDNFKKGSTCPCCGQFVKRYRRILNSGMTRSLIVLCKKSETEFIHVEDYFRKINHNCGHNWALLRYWNLIEEKPKDEELMS